MINLRGNWQLTLSKRQEEKIISLDSSYLPLKAWSLAPVEDKEYSMSDHSACTDAHVAKSPAGFIPKPSMLMLSNFYSVQIQAWRIPRSLGRHKHTMILRKSIVWWALLKKTKNKTAEWNKQQMWLMMPRNSWSSAMVQYEDYPYPLRLPGFNVSVLSMRSGPSTDNRSKDVVFSGEGMKVTQIQFHLEQILKDYTATSERSIT